MGLIEIAGKTIERKCAMCDTDFPVLFTPHIQLWAKGYARHAHQPAIITLSVLYCLACRPSTDEFMDEMFSPESRKELNAATEAAGKAPFNFASAIIDWKEVMTGGTGNDDGPRN